MFITLSIIITLLILINLYIFISIWRKTYFLSPLDRTITTILASDYDLTELRAHNAIFLNLQNQLQQLSFEFKEVLVFDHDENIALFYQNAHTKTYCTIDINPLGQVFTVGFHHGIPQNHLSLYITDLPATLLLPNDQTKQLPWSYIQKIPELYEKFKKKSHSLNLNTSQLSTLELQRENDLNILKNFIAQGFIQQKPHQLKYTLTFKGTMYFFKALYFPKNLFFLLRIEKEAKAYFDIE